MAVAILIAMIVSFIVLVRCAVWNANQPDYISDLEAERHNWYEDYYDF